MEYNLQTMHCPTAAFSPFLFPVSWAAVRALPHADSLSFVLVNLLIPLSFLRYQVFVLLCMVTGMAPHTRPMCACPPLLTVPCLAKLLVSWDS